MSPGPPGAVEQLRGDVVRQVAHHAQRPACSGGDGGVVHLDGVGSQGGVVRNKKGEDGDG